MKIGIFFMLVLLFNQAINSQTKADSIIANYEAAKTEKEQVEVLYGVFDLFNSENSKQSRKFALEVLAHLKKKKDYRNADFTKLYIASMLNYTGDYTGALQMCLVPLDNAIKRNDTTVMSYAYQNIGDAYITSRNYDKAFAALLVPMHHKLEHWASTKLVEKNKQIRLAAAKKTIGQLETNSGN